MPVYATSSPVADRRFHSNTLLLIIGGHVALLAAVMSARMDLPDKIVRQITEVELIREPVEPPPPEPQPQPRQEPRQTESHIERVPPILDIPLPDAVAVDPLPMPLPLPDPGALIGQPTDPSPNPGPTRAVEPVRVGPRLATPASQLRPPYPQSKLEREEEAALKLRLTIDKRGRVVAVEPVGQTDRIFLEAARRHLIAKWRYKPATEDGHAVASSTVITLRFMLDD